MALLPLAATGDDSYVRYSTSAAPTASGLAAAKVTAPGVQKLTIAPANALLLFNIAVSIEQDARNDLQYMTQLQFDLQRVSELLYDWTDGQAALGAINIYHDKLHWDSADIRIYASNHLRPNAGQGGITKADQTDPGGSAVYEPGRVRIGATWNRQSDPDQNIGDDWPRALAHELGHFAFYLDDNYKGDRMIDLGQPTNDQVLARGARPGDRLCVFDLAGDHLGCAALDSGNNELKLGARANWKPDLIVTPVTSRTLSIAVPMTGVGAPLPAELTARLYSIDSSQPPASATLALKGGLYQGAIGLAEPALEGYLHVYVENDSEPQREIVTDYTLGGNPAPPRRPPRRSRRRAPGISSDGQVILFADDLDFQPGQFYSIQTATNLPALPNWATAVGQGYRLIASPDAPSLEHVGINMAYAESAVPLGTERGLAIYFLPAGGGAWQRLPTQVSVDRNEASSQLKGPGTYVLMASIDISLTKVGWNLLFFYPGASQQPVAQALGSIAGKYTTVYGYDDTDAADPWKIYDIGAPGWANDLNGLEYGHGYWIRTTEPVSVSLKPGEQARLAGARDTGGILSAPPATYYGPVLAATGFTPAPGMPVLARVNDTVCGESVTQSLAGQVVFSVNVLAAGTGDAADCGLFGQPVSFEIGGHMLDQTSTWDNSRPRNLGSFVYLSQLRH